MNVAVIALSVLLALAAVGGLGMFLSLKTLRQRLSQAEERLQALDRQQAWIEQGRLLDALKAGTVGVGDHLRQLEDDLLWLRGKLEKLELNEGAGQANYAQAIRRAAKGATASELVEDYGLSRNEAELLLMLHREDASPG